MDRKKVQAWVVCAPQVAAVIIKNGQHGHTKYLPVSLCKTYLQMPDTEQYLVVVYTLYAGRLPPTEDTREPGTKQYEKASTAAALQLATQHGHHEKQLLNTTEAVW